MTFMNCPSALGNCHSGVRVRRGVPAGLALHQAAVVLPVREGAFDRAAHALVDREVDELRSIGEPRLEAGGRPQDGDGRVFAGHPQRVVVPTADRRQLVVVVAGAHHRPAEGDLHQVVRGPVRPRPLAAERRHGAPDERLAVAATRSLVPAGARGIEHVVPGGVDDCIGALDELPPQREAVGSVDVEGDAALARVEVRPVQRAVRVRAVARERPDAPRGRTGGRLDADHVGAGVGQQLPGDLAQVTDLDDAESFGAGAHIASSSCSRASSSSSQPSSASTSSLCSPSSGEPRRTCQPKRSRRNGSPS